MRTDSDRHRGARGFTLIELLVALSILSLCAVLLFEGLHLGIGVWRANRTRAETIEAVASTQRFLRARLEYLEPFQTRNTSEPIRAVIGLRDSLEFSSPPPDQMGPGSLRYQLRMRTTRDSRDVTVRWRRDWDGAIDRVAGPDWHEEVLLPDVRGLEFEYLVIDPLGTPTWRTEWSETHGAPAAIRVSVRFPEGDRREWLAFTVQPRIDADAHCEFDMVSRQCRTL